MTRPNEGYCTRCDRYTFAGMHVSSIKDRRKWEFVCEWCRMEDGENDANMWTEEDERDRQADMKFHRLRDEGKI